MRKESEQQAAQKDEEIAHRDEEIRRLTHAVSQQHEPNRPSNDEQQKEIKRLMASYNAAEVAKTNALAELASAQKRVTELESQAGGGGTCCPHDRHGEEERGNGPGKRDVGRRTEATGRGTEEERGRAGGIKKKIKSWNGGGGIERGR